MVDFSLASIVENFVQVKEADQACSTSRRQTYEYAETDMTDGNVQSILRLLMVLKPGGG